MTVKGMANNQMSNAMMRVASGKRINSAADDAAGLAISTKMDAQIRGYEQGIANTRDMQNLTNTAEGGLATIGGALGRIRELSLQASNGIYTDADRQLIQGEISQLADHIQTTVKNTEFNTIPLLDGSAQSLHTASYPDGSGTTVNINDMSGLAKAIANFNVTGEFNIGDIDAAMAEVNGERANLGALSNRFDFTADANSLTALNMADARSRIADADMVKEMMNVRKEQTLSQIQILMQQNEQARMRNQQINPIVAPAQ
ncbi:MAG: flagellin [Defluviitaleaceae bacterium]|nr:flagellin [Defluviitaleaceae bacterium]